MNDKNRERLESLAFWLFVALLTALTSVGVSALDL